MKIERAVPGDLDQIIVVLDEATLELLNKGIPQWKYPWYSESVRKELDYQYVVRELDRIIAVFSVRPLGNSSYGSGRKNDYYLYRIAVLPEYQGKGTGRQILRYVQKLCRRERINVYLDCYCESKKLKGLYEKEGFFYQGDYPEKDYYVSVYRYLWKDTPKKNKLRNEMKKRKRELRFLGRVAVAVLPILLLFNMGTVLKYLDRGIHMTPGVVVGEYTYWEDDSTARGALPVDAEESGTIKEIVPGGQWPDQPMEAVGIPRNLKGEKVYLSSDENFAYIYNRSKRQYITFQKEFRVTNNNYSNGFYSRLLKACGPKETIPLMDVPEDYTLEQARKDGLALYLYNDMSMDMEGSENMEAFMENADKKGKAFLRIGRFMDNGENYFIDVFYYKKNYYVFSKENPDIYNARFTYLNAGNISSNLGLTATEKYTVYILSQNNNWNPSDYLLTEVTGNYVVLFVTKNENQETTENLQ